MPVFEVEYRVVPFLEAKKHNWPGTETTDDYHDDWTSIVYRFENGEPVAVIGTDGGEPEDQTLRRDWAWVVFALNNAYRSGQTDALAGVQDSIAERQYKPQEMADWQGKTDRPMEEGG